MIKKEIVVIGFGNSLMGDEGIGNFLISELAKRERIPGVAFLDLGTSGIVLLHAIVGKEKAIFLDCARMGEEPGVIKKFTPEEVQSNKKVDDFSFHEGDLLGYIELSQWLGECPAEIVIFGIEPELISPRQLLTDTLMEKIEEYLAMIIKELKIN